MKTNNSYIKALFFTLIFVSFFSTVKAQIEITYETEIFGCAYGLEETASFNCSFNGTLSYEIVGDPDERLHIAIPENVVNGAFTFVYQIDAPSPTLIEVIWTIETSDDATGCAQAGVSITTFMPIDCECFPTIQVLPVTHESCYQCADGSAQLLVTGMYEPIMYEWDNGATTSIIENLAPGTYNLTATGANLDPCIGNGTVMILPYECATTQIVYGSSDILCGGTCDGIIDIQGLENGSEITGVLWADGSTELLREDLCAGFYSGTVTASDNCPYSIEVNIAEPQVLELEIKEITHVNNSETGTIQVSAEGGLPPYSFSVSQNGEPIEHDSTSNEIINLAAGCYAIEVKDDNGCMAIQDSVCIDNVSATQNISASDFSIFPNPCYEYLDIKIDGDYKVIEINIYDILGKKQEHTMNENKIDLSHFNNGIFIIDIVTDQGHWVRQFVKSKM